jgi:hypothetical protein
MMSNPTGQQHAIGAHKTLLLSTEDVVIRVARELCCPYPDCGEPMGAHAVYADSNRVQVVCQACHRDVLMVNFVGADNDEN